MEDALALNTLQASQKKGGVFCTLNIQDEKDQDLLLSSQDNEEMEKINDHVGEFLTVIGIFVKEREVEGTNDEGEVISYYKHNTILFTEDDKMYVTGSNSFWMSLDFIMTLKGIPTRENPLKIKISQSDAKEKGHKYLKAVIAK